MDADPIIDDFIDDDPYDCCPRHYGGCLGPNPDGCMLFNRVLECCRLYESPALPPPGPERAGSRIIDD